VRILKRFALEADAKGAAVLRGGLLDGLCEIPNLAARIWERLDGGFE
jgi:hypothetical protein